MWSRRILGIKSTLSSYFVISDPSCCHATGMIIDCFYKNNNCLCCHCYCATVCLYAIKCWPQKTLSEDLRCLLLGVGGGFCFGRCMKSGNEWKKEILGKYHFFLDLAFWCAASLSYLIFLFYLFGSMFASFFWLLLCRISAFVLCLYIFS